MIDCYVLKIKVRTDVLQNSNIYESRLTVFSLDDYSAWIVNKNILIEEFVECVHFPENKPLSYDEFIDVIIRIRANKEKHLLEKELTIKINELRAIEEKISKIDKCILTK